MNRHLRIALIGLLIVAMPGTGIWLASPRTAAAVGRTLHLDKALTWVSGTPTTSSESNESFDESWEPVPDAFPPFNAPGSVVVEHSVGETPYPVAVTYTPSQVMRWAYERSPEGRLIESEIQAVMRAIDPKDKDACCAARLIRNVLSEVALARRADDATHAIVAYHKLIAANLAVTKIDEAIAIQDRLIAMSDEAERLELPDGDPLKLRQARLELLDLKSQQRFNGLKLRQELSRLTGRDEAEVALAIMIAPLPEQAPDVVAGEMVATALAQRHDLRAVAVLCRDLNSCNIDAARLLMGIVSPGVGLSLATAAKGLFSCLKDDPSDNDLNARRRQCSQLHESLKTIIRNETLQTVLDVRAVNKRLELMDQRIALTVERLDQTRGAVRLDESPVGSDLLVELELFELQGLRIGLQKDLALAMDNLDHVRSMPLP
ncbi:TolC family protein [Neorhodopirellula lusitana]|uniref:hypothetical protein n=1 Tax=Neorhodopirellula lusitana TaxID=445327 RepID=UPI00384FC06D